MNKIINGVASEYDMPMKYENKSTTIFIDTQDMEERYGEQLYQEYLEKENKQLKQKVDQLENTLNEVKEYILEKCPHSAVFRNERIDEIYEILNKVGGSNE